MSRGGIFVHSRQPFAVGTQLRLDLQLLNGTPLIVGEGTVFWTREPDPNKPANVPGMGIRFSKLSGRSQQVIDQVLSQRTGRERTGLFSTVSQTISVEESQKILTSNPKSKLPFNVFPGSKPHDPSKSSDDREQLATAGREETTPVVGVTAANLADARPSKDEPSSKTPLPGPAPAAPIAEMGSGPSASGGSKRQPPALALIRPDASPGKDRLAESGKLPLPAHMRRSSSANMPVAPVTTTQEISPTSGSTPPARVQGEPALGASQSGLPRPSDATPIQSVRPPMARKLIIGAAALLAVTITVFATTRKSAVPPGSANPGGVAHVTAPGATATRSTDPERPAIAALPSATGTAATETAPEANAAPAQEEAPAPSTTSGSAKSAPSRAPDRRAPKGKTVVAKHESQPAPHAAAPAPSEKPPVAEAPAPRVEIPAPTPPPPPPAPVAVVREAPPAIKAAPTAPPPVAALAHKLRMTSIPSEAEVELDGKSIGRTPLFGVEIDVSRPHALVVRKDGYAPFKQTISTGSEWNVRPSENTATLRVSALMKKL